MAYDIAGLKKEFGGMTPRGMTLVDFLRYGHLSELCGVILDKGLEGELLTQALKEIPPTAMISVMYLRLVPPAPEVGSGG